MNVSEKVSQRVNLVYEICLEDDEKKLIFFPYHSQTLKLSLISMEHSKRMNAIVDAVAHSSPKK